MIYVCKRCDKEFPCTYDDNLDEGSRKRPTLCPHDNPLARAYGTAFERVEGVELSFEEILNIVLVDFDGRKEMSGMGTPDSDELKQIGALHEAFK